MDVAQFLVVLLAILLSARILGEVAAYFGAPPVIGELLAGILIGPSVLGWVEMNELIHILAEFGVILLLFQVGLETDTDKLIESGAKSALVAVGGFVAPFVLGYLLCDWLFNLPLLVCLFVGGTLTATSIGITVRTLTDLGKQNSKEGQITLGAAVLDDILGVILLAVLYDFSVSGEIGLQHLLKTLGFIGAFFIFAPVLAKYLSRAIEKVYLKAASPGLLPTIMVSIVLFFAWLAHIVGAPELLGGFAAGLALSRRFSLPFGLAARARPQFAKDVVDEMRPIVHLFAPIFFVSVGLSLDFRGFDWSSGFFWWFSLCLAIIAILSKFAGAIFISEPLPRRIAVGMAMVPRGEVGLIFAGLGSAAGVFSGQIYTALILVIAYTTLASPFWIKLFYRHHGRYFAKAI